MGLSAAIVPFLIAFAAVGKAFSDTLDHHFDTSIFRYKSRKWFDPNVNIKSAPKIFNYPLDAWHISESLQICSWLAIPFLYEQQFDKWYFDYLIGGGLFIVVFNTFYNKVFR